MPPQQNATHSLNSLQNWTTLLALVVAALSIFAGMQLARGNSDIICTSAVNDEGACANGSWGAWTTVSQGGGESVERRTYTGTKNILAGTFTYRRVVHQGCGGGPGAGGTGTITSQYAACQIEETRVRAVGTGAGGEEGDGSIVSTTRNESTGAVDETQTQTSQGTYQTYLDMVDARLATSSIRAVPSIVRKGTATTVIWTSDHVRSCTVTGSNGDAWPKPTTETAYETQTDGEGNQVQVPVQRQVMPKGLTGEETSAPIQSQTIYTLACKTALGTVIGGEAIVNILPEFQEL